MTKREKALDKLIKKVDKAAAKHPGIVGELIAASQRIRIFCDACRATNSGPACPPAFDESKLARHRIFAEVVEENFDHSCPGKRVMAYFHDCDGKMHVMTGPDGKDGERPEVWTGLL